MSFGSNLAALLKSRRTKQTLRTMATQRKLRDKSVNNKAAGFDKESDRDTDRDQYVKRTGRRLRRNRGVRG